MVAALHKKKRYLYIAGDSGKVKLPVQKTHFHASEKARSLNASVMNSWDKSTMDFIAV